MKEKTKNTLLKLAGAFLIVDGIASLIYYHKSPDKLPHIGRVIRTLVGVGMLVKK